MKERDSREIEKIKHKARIEIAGLSEKLVTLREQKEDVNLGIEMAQLRQWYPEYYIEDSKGVELIILKRMNKKKIFDAHSAFVDLFKPSMEQQIGFLHFRDKKK